MQLILFFFSSGALSNISAEYRHSVHVRVAWASRFLRLGSALFVLWYTFRKSLTIKFMPKVYVTHPIPDRGIKLLQEKGYEVGINPDEHVLSKEDVVSAVQGRGYDAILSLLNDKIDAAVFDAAGEQLKIVANYAVGYDNIDVAEAAKRGVLVSNTPGVLNESVSELTFALMLAIGRRVVEADKFMRAGKYTGWTPMLLLGDDIANKTLGVVGLGRIGSLVVKHATKGFDMNVIYHDVKRNGDFEKEYGAVYKENLEDLLKEADFVTLHVPLLPATKHLMNAERLAMMKPSAYLINTSRGPVIDEKALADALASKTIKGAAIDVFENEPKMEPALQNLDNIIVTPHIASGTVETRQKMSAIAAQNIIAAMEGTVLPNPVAPRK
jgi:glyoxylate reductase